MKYIIVLRHGEKQGDNLTPQGIAACIALANRLEPIDVVFASPRHRTIQTAELITNRTVKVDDRANVPGFPGSELHKLSETQQTHKLGIIGAIWENPSLIEDTRIAGEKLLDLVREVMRGLSTDQRALIVSHDGTMIGLEKLLRGESFATVDHSFGSLEGIIIDEHFTVHNFPY